MEKRESSLRYASLDFPTKSGSTTEDFCSNRDNLQNKGSKYLKPTHISETRINSFPKATQKNKVDVQKTFSI